MICRGLFLSSTLQRQKHRTSFFYKLKLKCYLFHTTILFNHCFFKFIGEIQQSLSASDHLGVFPTQVLQLLLHPLQRLQEVVVLPGQPLVLLKYGLHLALGLSHPL